MEVGAVSLCQFTPTISSHLCHMPACENRQRFSQMPLNLTIGFTPTQELEMPFIILDGDIDTFELLPGSRLTELEIEYPGSPIIPFGCRLGVCGACLIEVSEGIGNLGVQSQKEADFIRRLGHDPATHRLACQCVLNGNARLASVARATSSLAANGDPLPIAD